MEEGGNKCPPVCSENSRILEAALGDRLSFWWIRSRALPHKVACPAETSYSRLNRRLVSEALPALTKGKFRMQMTAYSFREPHMRHSTA